MQAITGQPNPTNGHTTPLRIAMVAPPWFEVPPEGYGGIEAMCAVLVDELVSRGHEVILLGAGRDRTLGKFVPVLAEPPSVRLGDPMVETLYAALSARALQELDVDVVHDHCLVGPLAAAGRFAPTVVTGHGPMHADLGHYYRALDDAIHLVAISESQRRDAPDLPWAGTVHNAVVVDDLPYRDRAGKEDWCLFLGRMSPEKGALHAIAAARASGRRLLLIGKCNEPPEHNYFEQVVRPHLGSGAEWLGEVDTATRNDLLARAACLLFPIQWEEPFGMVMVEAMACGTPVVALRRGAAPEVIAHGVSGLLCDRPDELPAAIDRAALLDPARCRRHAREHFDVAVMAAGYERVYQRVLARVATAPA